MCNIVADPTKSLLVQKHRRGAITPVARLMRKMNFVAAPGVARRPFTSSAQRWHQRLGHVGQNISKQTAIHTKVLQGIDLSQVTTCETCHLRRAQRFVSREPRPKPHSPLDEIFIDTVGKITAATNGHQYAVIIIDYKTRMRWALTTQTKDQIAPLLVQWINSQHHQHGKKVRAMFRDGGTKFLRLKPYCEQNGICTDISAPDTPEQNGVSEAATKVILRLARFMLIAARMPAIYWPLVVQHVCFFVNRLFCLRTKQIPPIDFMQSLNQPHTG
ncbi:hypothetical protein K3495_g12836 [Podosphaera aphanis]|nr:hypothetical protein K3495_g12836 [Podosphaera aphanis]